MGGRGCRLKTFSRLRGNGGGLPLVSVPSFSASSSPATRKNFYRNLLSRTHELKRRRRFFSSFPFSSLEEGALPSSLVRAFASSSSCEPPTNNPSSSLFSSSSEHASSASTSSCPSPGSPVSPVSPSTSSVSSSLSSSSFSVSDESVKTSTSLPWSFPLGVKHSKTSILAKEQESLSSPSSTSQSPSSLEIFETPEGTRWVSSIALSRYLSRCIGLGYLQALLEDSTVEEDEVFDLLWTRVLKSPPSSSSSHERAKRKEINEERSDSEEDTGGSWKVHVEDLTQLFQGCVAVGLRDFTLLDVLSDVLSPLLTCADIAQLTDISQSCRALGVLRPLLFSFLASRLLTLSQSSSSLPSCRLLPSQAVLLLEGLSSQRYPHAELLPLLEDAWASSLSSLSPRLACRIVHALANLGRSPQQPERLELLFDRISAGLSINEQTEIREKDEEEEANPSAHLRLTDLARVAHALFLWDIQKEQKPLLIRLLNVIATEIARRPDSFWSKSPSEASLHKRLLLVRSGLRHLHREEIYDELPGFVKNSLRRLHRLEIQRDPRPPTNFVTKMSALLTRLRIAHFCYATRGPLVFDIVERDRRLVWFCNSVDRFYVNSSEKTTSTRLKERLTRSLGLRVVNCEYWQWTKMK
ncbi:rap domain-containing protein [Cystoisospora suis]|uniref:Rap domain-containing protein n=1 Tax=Cystoisospora suis TaxID=483139 RepID=A0A2C6KWJ4_9APIC|nr:rap domain-containing protein [Cystoisospora suis]